MTELKYHKFCVIILTEKKENPRPIKVSLRFNFMQMNQLKRHLSFFFTLHRV